MSNQAAATRVLVRVRPRLLAETLCRSLRAGQFDAVVCPIPERRRRGRGPQSFAVAVTTGPLPDQLSARGVVLLGEAGDIVRVVCDGVEQSDMTATGLAGLIELVRDLVDEQVGDAEHPGATD